MATLLEQAIDAHGGMKLWQACKLLTARLAFGGFAFASRFKFMGGEERRFEISTRLPRTVMHDYPRPHTRGIFMPDRVWIESDAGEIIDGRVSPRAAFRTFRHNLWWDWLDLLYFAGYASWNYFTTPFLLAMAGVETKEIEPWQENGETWQRLAVNFPETIPTHCREQVFYFDDRLHLRRFDYAPEVYASWAKAAHYCSEYENFSGLLIPTKRYVVPRAPDGRSRAKPTLVWIDVKEIRLE